MKPWYQEERDRARAFRKSGAGARSNGTIVGSIVPDDQLMVRIAPSKVAKALADFLAETAPGGTGRSRG